MRILKILCALAAVSLGVAACAVTPAESENDDAVTSALSGTGKACSTDSSCVSGDVCEPHCPVIPGRLHCEIAGGTCEPRCTRSTASLHGETFTSSNGAHSITFAAGGTFSKTDGCDPTPGGVTCHHIQLTTGTYKSSSTGKTITLTPTVGSTQTLSVGTHRYEGLHDNTTGQQLYPSP